MTAYSIEVIAAARRVGLAFVGGCDRGVIEDFEMLEGAGLMDRGVCSDTFGQDTLEIGETMWTFNEAGEALIKAITGASN